MNTFRGLVRWMRSVGGLVWHSDICVKGGAELLGNALNLAVHLGASSHLWLKGFG